MQMILIDGYGVNNQNMNHTHSVKDRKGLVRMKISYIWVNPLF